MCGIVGHLGSRASIDFVLQGLERLEYRGYDSAGIASLGTDLQISVRKDIGKVSQLKALYKVGGTDQSAIGAIGHTRWATHGEVTPENAHPHNTESFSVVHNGIIENADVLKRGLLKGHQFKSQTDTEVFVALLEHFYHDEKDIRKVLFRAFAEIEGNAAFVVMSKNEKRIWAIKRAAPLVWGHSGPFCSDVLVSSDPYALTGECETLSFPDDLVLGEAAATDDGVELKFFDSELKAVSNVTSRPAGGSAEDVGKGDFEHYMLKEIFEQPQLVARFQEIMPDHLKEQLSEMPRDFNKVVIVGCGSAWHAGLVFQDYLRRDLRIPTEIFLSSEFRYQNPIIGEGDLAVFISQSGETADTLASQALAKKLGATTLAIVNVPESGLARECDYQLFLHAGPEIGVASTKAFLMQSLVGMALGDYLKFGELSTQLNEESALLASKIRTVLDRRKELYDLAESLVSSKGFIFTGRGPLFPIALEGALKLKEIAYVHAEGYASGELKHGPIALIDQEMVNICLIGLDLIEKALSNAEEVRARRGKVILIAPEGIGALASDDMDRLEFDFEDLPRLHGTLASIVMQLLSYYIAKLKGTDIDKPRNLAKSVTVE